MAFDLTTERPKPSKCNCIGNGTQSGTNTGDVTLAGTPNYLTIVGQVITRHLIDLANWVTGRLPFANLAQIAGRSVLGVAGSSTADVAAITASADGQVLTRVAGALAFATPASPGTGDVVGPSSSVDGEGVLFDGTTGKLLKRATGTGIVRRASGVDSVAELSGDATTSGSNALTLANSGASAGTYGSATLAPVVTVDAKGRVTSITTATITPGGGSGGALTLIAEQLLGSDVATVTFSSIPGTYRHLHLIAYGRLTASVVNDYVYVQFNGDTGANYDEQRWNSAATVTTAGESFAQTKSRVSEFAGASSSASTQPGSFELLVPHYAGTTWQKIAQVNGGSMSGTTTQGLVRRAGTIGWRSTAAITDITFLLASGNFKTGSLFSLYGMS